MAAETVVQVVPYAQTEIKATIDIGVSITLDYKGTKVCFKIGDTAEYDSYNLRYLGEVVSITEKSVTIQPKYNNKKTRLKIENFAWRNKGFNLEEVMAENANTSHYI
jgi:preprotein translocase subunit YajC